MQHAVAEVGDKFHIMTRRLFENDLRRHFVGEVLAVSGGLAELEGYTFIFQASMNEYQRLPDTRVRVFSLGEAGHIVNKLPRNVELEAVGYRMIENRRVVTDGAFVLAINEFSATA
jgi:hypothetical protein